MSESPHRTGRRSFLASLGAMSAAGFLHPMPVSVLPDLASAPGDFIIYSGKLFKGWKDQAIIGGMKPTVLVRVAFDGERAREVARDPMERRIREVVEAPDGSILLLEDKAGARLWRLTPG